MPGMIFELFLLLVALIVATLIASAGWRKVWPLLIAALFMLLAGGVLISEGLRIETGSTFEKATGILTYNYDVLLPTTDFTVFVFSNTLFYGGWIVLIVALGLLVFKRLPGVEG